MKTFLISFCLIIILVACGKSSNNVNSSNTESTSEFSVKASRLQTNFEGVYDLVSSDTPDCGASIRIVSECSGYILYSNLSMKIEKFCNISNTTLNTTGAFSPPPDRDGKIVVLEGNQLKSILRITPNKFFISTLTLQTNGILVKVSDLKSSQSRCVFEKR